MGRRWPSAIIGGQQSLRAAVVVELAAAPRIYDTAASENG